MVNETYDPPPCPPCSKPVILWRSVENAIDDLDALIGWLYEHGWSEERTVKAEYVIEAVRKLINELQN